MYHSIEFQTGLCPGSGVTIQQMVRSLDLCPGTEYSSEACILVPDALSTSARIEIGFIPVGSSRVALARNRCDLIGFKAKNLFSMPFTPGQLLFWHVKSSNHGDQPRLSNNSEQ